MQLFALYVTTAFLYRLATTSSATNGETLNKFGKKITFSLAAHLTLSKFVASKVPNSVFDDMAWEVTYKMPEIACSSRCSKVPECEGYIYRRENRDCYTFAYHHNSDPNWRSIGIGPLVHTFHGRWTNTHRGFVSKIQVVCNYPHRQPWPAIFLILNMVPKVKELKNGTVPMLPMDPLTSYIQFKLCSMHKGDTEEEVIETCCQTLKFTPLNIDYDVIGEQLGTCTSHWHEPSKYIKSSMTVRHWGPSRACVGLLRVFGPSGRIFTSTELRAPAAVLNGDEVNSFEMFLGG